ncbi:MAG: endonuclease/exonuclease/phosphatase family protein [Candidatus Moraniibacteriota bacterium]
MKIVFLNTWNGKIQDKIAEFIKEQVNDTDIFCFQEVYAEMKIICKELLADYVEISAYKFVIKNDDFPQATYVRKNLNILSSEIIFDRDMDCGLGIYLQIKNADKNIHVCNFHGLSQPGHKLDNPNRLKQSRGLIDFFQGKKGAIVIGGDFNLFPETKSIQMFEENGYGNLIKDYKIATTRNKFAWEMYPESKQYYSDYIFANGEVKVKNFLVPSIEVSDHLPLILDFE